MNIGVIGVGGVGGYFGGKLCSLLGSNSWPDLKNLFYSPQPAFGAIKQNGLILSTVEEGGRICRPTLATENIIEMQALSMRNAILLVRNGDH